MDPAIERYRDTSSRPRLVTTVNELKGELDHDRRRGARIGLVPTMGALHAGHLSLVRAARQSCERTVVTIFVNPTQFGPQEDLQKYPRTLPADLAALESEQADLVFAPSDELIYPPGFSTYVEPPAVSLPWEGQFRPGHFRGVATVVLKLFHLIPADIAFFGQKDFQQCQVIRRMVSDLNLGLEIQVCPIVREPDGLAMSSRNRYLNAAERERARGLSRALAAGQALIESGERRAEVVSTCLRRTLAESGVDQVNYAVAADPDTLAEWSGETNRVVLLIAAFVGKTRLIDNCLIG